MRRFLVGLVLAVTLFSSATLAFAKDVYVHGYFRSNGTFVMPYYRSAPDGNFYNNWSTIGNINPYTGTYGTKVTPPPSYGSYGYVPYSYDPNPIIYSPQVTPTPSYGYVPSPTIDLPSIGGDESSYDLTPDLSPDPSTLDSGEEDDSTPVLDDSGVGDSDSGE